MCICALIVQPFIWNSERAFCPENDGLFGFLRFKASHTEAKLVVKSLLSEQLIMRKVVCGYSVFIEYFEMKHFICLISKINMRGSKANPQMCWKWPLFKGPGTLPKRLPLVLGSERFIVTHGLCCFMGLSTSQERFLWGNSALLDAQSHFLLGGIMCRLNMELPLCLFDPWPRCASDPPPPFKVYVEVSVWCGLLSHMLPVCQHAVCFHGCKSGGALLDSAAVKREVLVLVRTKVRYKMTVSPTGTRD